MDTKQSVVRFIEAKSSARLAFNDMVMTKADEMNAELLPEDRDFVKNDHIIRVVEFFVLLHAYGVNDGKKIRFFAARKNDDIEARIAEIRLGDEAAGIKAAHISDLQKGLFSPQALDRLEWTMEHDHGIEQAALARFLAAYMSDTWLKRCLSILVAVQLLKVVNNQLGGKVYQPADDLFELYEKTVTCFTAIWEGEPA